MRAHARTARASSAALLLAALAAVADAGCKTSECKPEDPPKSCPCPGAPNGTQACVDGRLGPCACQPANPTGPTNVVGAGVVPGGDKVTSDFCRNNCKGQSNTCKGSGTMEPGVCEKELNDCLARCPQ